jgi:hypothetical protein
MVATLGLECKHSIHMHLVTTDMLDHYCKEKAKKIYSMLGNESLSRSNLISRLHFLFQHGDMLIEHGHHRLKLSHLMVYRVNLGRVLLKPLVFLIQLLHEDSQTRCNISIAIVFLCHTLIHLFE